MKILIRTLVGSELIVIAEVTDLFIEMVTCPKCHCICNKVLGYQFGQPYNKYVCRECGWVLEECNSYNNSTTTIVTSRLSTNTSIVK